MLIFDRYIVVVFFKIFLICLISFVGLFIIIDAFSNLEEFLDLGKQGSLTEVLISYYGPRVLQLFDRMAPLIALVAAIFSLALMQRSNELTAIGAAGIARRRIAKPLLIATGLIVALTVMNRECLIPHYRQQLAMSAQDMAAGKGRTIGLTVDHETGLVIRGKEVMPAHQTIEAPEFRLPAEFAEFSNRIVAEDGAFLPANDQHPAGYLLNQVSVGNDPAGLPSQFGADGQPAILRPADNPWLRDDQVFVVTDVDTIQLAFSRQLTRYASLWEIVQSSRRPTTSFSNRHRVDIHARLVQPFFDMSILLIGLPLVISRGERNLFVAAGICLSVVMLMILTVIVSHSLGAARILKPPSLAAWLPIILFVPLGTVTWQWLDR